MIQGQKSECILRFETWITQEQFAISIQSKNIFSFNVIPKLIHIRFRGNLNKRKYREFKVQCRISMKLFTVSIQKLE